MIMIWTVFMRVLKDTAPVIAGDQLRRAKLLVTVRLVFEAALPTVDSVVS